MVTKSVFKNFFDTSKFKSKQTQKKESLEIECSKEEVTYQTVYHQDELLNNLHSPLSPLQSSEQTVRPIPIPSSNSSQPSIPIQNMFGNFSLANEEQVANINSVDATSISNAYPVSFSAVDQQSLPLPDHFNMLPLDQQLAYGSQGSQFYLNQYPSGGFANFANSTESLHTSHSESNSQTNSQANSYHGSFFEDAMGSAPMLWGEMNPPSAGYASSASSVCSNGFLGEGVVLDPALLSASLDACRSFNDAYAMNSIYQPIDTNIAHSMTDLPFQNCAMYSTVYSSTPNLHPLSPQSSTTQFKSPTQHTFETAHHRFASHINSKNICPFPGCHKIFSKAYNCSTHYLTHFPNRVRAHICPVCGRGFDRKYDLGRHISTKRHHPPEGHTSLEA